MRQLQALAGDYIYPDEIQRWIARLTLALDSWFAASVEVAEGDVGVSRARACPLTTKSKNRRP